MNSNTNPTVTNNPFLKSARQNTNVNQNNSNQTETPKNNPFLKSAIQTNATQKTVGSNENPNINQNTNTNQPTQNWNMNQNTQNTNQPTQNWNMNQNTQNINQPTQNWNMNQNSQNTNQPTQNWNTQSTQTSNVKQMMNDQIIATDLLLSAKTGVRNYAYAITEVATPQIKQALVNQMNEAIMFHDRISKYMMNKGYYPTNDIQQMINNDLTNADKALNIQT